MNIKKMVILMVILSFSLLLISQMVQYKVQSSKCIGCGLCVQSKTCPVNAITMKNGKAIIEIQTCIGCGICKNGNNSYKGCPVNAITSEAITQKTNTEPVKSKTTVSNVSDQDKVESDKIKPKKATETVVKADSTKKAEVKEENIIKKVIYFVEKKICIGCRMCESQCPVNAISMVNGKAVIDTEKCISCGLCKNGNPSTNYKGCPVSAIKTK